MCDTRLNECGTHSLRLRQVVIGPIEYNCRGPFAIGRRSGRKSLAEQVRARAPRHVLVVSRERKQDGQTWVLSHCRHAQPCAHPLPVRAKVAEPTLQLAVGVIGREVVVSSA
eukprot:6205029-Pleurochrysis_carterae.AAC.5